MTRRASVLVNAHVGIVDRGSAYFLNEVPLAVPLQVRSRRKAQKERREAA